MDDLTQQAAGTQFICLPGTGCDIKHFARFREPRDLAGELLEELTEVSGQLGRLPADYPIPAGVTQAVDAAYQAALAWVEHLDRPQIRPRPRKG